MKSYDELIETAALIVVVLSYIGAFALGGAGIWILAKTVVNAVLA